MSLHRVLGDQFADDRIDYLIRRCLHDSVACAEPAPQVWERIEQHIVHNAGPTTVVVPAWRATLWQQLMKLPSALGCLQDMFSNDGQQVPLTRVLFAELRLINEWV